MERFISTCTTRKCMFWDGKSRVYLEIPTDPDEISVGYISWHGANQFMNLDETYEQIEEFVKSH